MSFQAWILVIFLARIPWVASLFLIIYTPVRRGNLDTRLLLVPFCLKWGAFPGGGLFEVISKLHEIVILKSIRRTPLLR